MAAIKAIESRSVHQIQSGQVIVDLQSVVKELVENSLDAGATRIDIRFKNQGLDSIEVQDNGKGIAPADYEGVALKHWTSKLQNYNDLNTLETFGFRGEALSSLCALSKLYVITARAEDGAVGKRLEYDISGKLKNTSVIAAQKGTTVVVESLFHNLPVRRKELEKNCKREYGKALNLLYAYACVAVNIRFTLSNQMPKGNKTVVISTKGNETVRDNIANVFGAKVLPTLIKLDLQLEMTPSGSTSILKRSKSDGSTKVEVQGHISKPIFGQGRQAPDRQMFFVNSRPCQLPQVSKAFNQVYKSFNVTQTPFIFANLIMDTNAYDVNVSPDKRTIMLHDQVELLEGLKASLTELFEQTDQTVPQSTSMSQKSLPRFCPLAVTSSALMDDDQTLSEPVVISDPNSSPKLPLRSASSKPVPSNKSVNLPVSTQPPSTNLTVPTQSPSTNLPISTQPPSSNLPIPTQPPSHPQSSPSHPPQWQTTSPGSQRIDPPGPIANAFDRMRPKRSQVQTAEISIGDVTTTTPIGSSNKRRRIHEPVNRDAIAAFSSSPPSGLGRFAVGRRGVGCKHVEERSEMSDVPHARRWRKGVDLEEDGKDVDEEVGDQDMDAVEREGEEAEEGDEPTSAGSKVTKLAVQISDGEGEEAEADDSAEDEQDDDEEEQYDDEADDDEAERDEQYDDEDEQDDDVAEQGASESDHEIAPHPIPLPKPPIYKSDPLTNKSHPTLSLHQTLTTSLAAITQLFSILPHASNPSSKPTNISDRTLSEPLTIHKSDFARMRIVGQFNRGFILALLSTLPSSTSSSSSHPESSTVVASPHSDSSTSSSNPDPSSKKTDSSLSSPSSNPSHPESSKDELFIIDQHAADEKFNYERLCKLPMTMQRLVRPIRLELTASQVEVVRMFRRVLGTSGFEIECREGGGDGDDNEGGKYEKGDKNEECGNAGECDHDGGCDDNAGGSDEGGNKEDGCDNQAGNNNIIWSNKGRGCDNETGGDNESGCNETGRNDQTGSDEAGRVGGGCNTTPPKFLLHTLPVSGNTTFNITDLEELLHTLFEGGGSLERKHTLCAMRACRSSVMVGRPLKFREMERIVKNLGNMEKPWSCPHGRPTMRHLISLGGLGWGDDELGI